MNPIVLVALLGFQTPDLSTKVSFEHRGARAAVVLESLSNTTGIKFSTSGQTADEVLVVKAFDAPLKDLMQKIADVGSASWIREGEGYRLIRTPAIEKREEREHRDLLARQVRRAQSTFRRMLETQGPFDGHRAELIGDRIRDLLRREQQEGDEGFVEIFLEQMKLGNETPASRLCAALFSVIEPSILAKVEPGEQLDFALSPKPHQTGLPRSAEALFSRYLEERKLFREKLGPIPRGDYGGRSFMALRMEESEGLRPILTFNRRGFVEVTSLELHVVDQEGKVTDWALFLVTNGHVYQVEGEPEHEGPQSGAPITLSKLSEEAARCEAKRRSASSGASPVASELSAYLLDPERNEVGGLVATDFLLALAKSKGLSLVASLTDAAALSCLSHVSENNPTLRDVAAWLADSDLTSSVEGVWKVVRPRDPYEARSVRVRRNELGTLARSAHKSRRVALGEFAAFASSHPSEVSGAFAIRYVELSTLGLGMEVPHSFSWGLLRLHGSLTVEQRLHLARGGALLLQNLASWQRDLVTRCVIGQTGMYAEDRNKPSDTSELDDEENESWLVYTSVPSEAYPRGLPGTASLKLHTGQELTIGFKADRNGRNDSFEYDIAKMAKMLLDQESGADDGASAITKMTDFWNAPKETYSYTLDGGSPVVHKGQLEDRGPRAKTVAKLDQLGPTIWKALKDKMDELRRDRARRNSNET